MRPIYPPNFCTRHPATSLLRALTLVVASGPTAFAQLGPGQASGPSTRPAIVRPMQGSSLDAANSNALGQQDNSNLRSTMPAASWTGTGATPSPPPTANRDSAQVVQASFAGKPQPTVASETERVGNKARVAIESRASDEDNQTTGSNSTLKMLFSMGSSLLIVLGLFFGVAWFYRKTLKTSMGGGLPKQVVHVLGRTPIAARQQLVLVRFGSKLVLVSLVQGEARTISEITDPLEVDQLAGACETSQPGSISASFRSILNQGGSAV